MLKISKYPYFQFKRGLEVPVHQAVTQQVINTVATAISRPVWNGTHLLSEESHLVIDIRY